MFDKMPKRLLCDIYNSNGRRICVVYSEVTKLHIELPPHTELATIHTHIYLTPQEPMKCKELQYSLRP